MLYNILFNNICYYSVIQVIEEYKQVYCKPSHTVAKALACRGTEFAILLWWVGKKGRGRRKTRI